MEPQPDMVIFMLGINDCYGADPASNESIDLTIDRVFQHADKLLASFHQTVPNADLGICLTTPGNASPEAFASSDGDSGRCWTWRRIQHRLVQRELEHFGNKQEENIFVIPTQLNLDTKDGFPANNAVHPNSTGYDQIGGTVYAWLKHRLATED